MMVLIDVFGKGGLTATERDTSSDRPVVEASGCSPSSGLLSSGVGPLSRGSVLVSYPGIDHRRYSENISMASRRASQVFICTI